MFFGLWNAPSTSNHCEYFFISYVLNFLCSLYSCGDGSLGEPPRRGEGQCGNMRLLLRQQQRVSNSELRCLKLSAFHSRES